MKKLIILFVTGLMVVPATAQFTAKMYFTSMGQDHVFTIYSADAGYRYEFNESGQEGVIIAKTGSPEIIILMPQQKMAMKGSIDNPMNMGNDPVGAYEYYKKDGTVKEMGKETIHGLECTKSELWNITGDEYGQVTQKMFTVWISDKYKFPVKIINHIDGSSDGSVMEIKEIEPWTPEPGYFEVPDGYQVMDMPNMMP